MYNRYIPQSDGSFQRSRMQDHAPRPENYRQDHRPSNPPEPTPCNEDASCRQNKCPRQNTNSRPPYYYGRSDNRNNSISGFLKNLLPKDFDTGDLLVVILLLLMSSDCPEDQNSALLTLALYLFM